MRRTPYEYYENKLGVKLSFLISDRNAVDESLKLISYNALHKRTKSATCTEKQLRRASLNFDGLVLYSSLSQEFKDRLNLRFGEPQKEVKRSWFAANYASDRAAFDFYAAHRYGDNNEKKLSTTFIERYTYNASVLNTVIKIKTNRKAYAKALGVANLNIWESLSKDVNAFRDVDHNLPNTPGGLRRKVNAYQNEGYISLVSKKLTNNNAAKVKEDEQLALLDELLAKHTNLDNMQVASLYNTVSERIGWKTITAQTVANRKEENNLVVFAGRNGANALSNKVLMQNKRMKPSAPMLYWTLDGWDAELLYQKSTTNKAGYAVTTYTNRLTMVVVLDPFNKYPVGYAIGTHENPQLIKEALRNAMQHTQELFGNFYRPYQLQSDHYGKGNLTPIYEACSTHYTPAKVKNAKSKVIEPWFNRFNKEYCQMFDNWSGHNVSSGSANQPNDEMLNKLRHQFPDEAGCRRQLEAAIEQDRAKKREDYVNQWQEVAQELRSQMSFETYLNFLGDTTGYSNKLMPEGLTPTINGAKLCFDSFDMEFRKQSHLDWMIKYDPADLSKVLAVNVEVKGGKIKQEIGTYQFILQQKYVQSMALADRQQEDAKQLEQVKQFNSDVMQYITDTRSKNYDILDDLFQKPALQDTLAKLILVDSHGQHKNQRNQVSGRSRELIEVEHTKTQEEKQQSWNQNQAAYHKNKVNLNDYL